MKLKLGVMAFTLIGVTGGLFAVSEAIIARPRGRALFCPFSRGLARGCACRFRYCRNFIFMTS